MCATDWKPIFADLAKTVVKTVFAVCDYAILVPPGVVFDANTLKLSYVEPGSPEKVLPLVQVSGVGGCTAQPSGYYYDNPLAPKSIHVCAPQCKVMSSSGSLKMDFGCE